MTASISQLISGLPPSCIHPADSALVDREAEMIDFDIWDLMRLAGKALANFVEDLLAPGSGHIAIYCGRGNNGGDGYVAAAALAQKGFKVSITAVQAPRSPLCQRAARLFAKAPARDPSHLPMINLQRRRILFPLISSSTLCWVPGSGERCVRKWLYG